MKIIELLNKIANGEEVPQKIKYLDSVYELNKESCYIDNGDLFVDHIYIDLSNLNDEIELIEDEEMDIQAIEEITERTYNNGVVTINTVERIVKKQNEIIQAVKQLDKRTRKKKE